VDVGKVKKTVKDYPTLLLKIDEYQKSDGGLLTRYCPKPNCNGQVKAKNM
jgi:hypothetical protein